MVITKSDKELTPGRHRGSNRASVSSRRRLGMGRRGCLLFGKYGEYMTRNIWNVVNILMGPRGCLFFGKYGEYLTRNIWNVWMGCGGRLLFGNHGWLRIR